jgi:hypothetical protein
MVYLTTATTKTLGAVPGILVTINLGFTGTITVADADGTKALITNPVLGNSFRYYGFNGSVSVTNSATGDITVSVLQKSR